MGGFSGVLGVFRIKGLAATDASMVLGLAGLNSAFFFISLYMQEVLHFSALRAGAAYVPIAAIVMAGSIGGSGLVPRLGTRPLIVAGAAIATGGLYWASRIPVHGYYWTDIFPPLMITGLGLGLVFVGAQIAGNAGVPPDKAGLAGALITASFQVGVALGLAILSALATARTDSLLSAHHPAPDALVGGYTRALLAAAFFVGAVIPIGLRAANTKGEPPGGTPTEITGVAVNDATGLRPLATRRRRSPPEAPARPCGPLAKRANAQLKTGTLRKSRYPAVPRPQTTARQLDDGPTAAIRCRRQAMNPRAYSTSRPVDGHALVTLADTGDTGRSR